MSIYSINEYYVKSSMSNTKKYEDMIHAFQLVASDMNKKLRNKQ